MINKQSIIIGYFRQGKSKKKLARELGVSLHTIRKYISLHQQEMLSVGLSPEDIPAQGIIQIPKYKSSPRKKEVLTGEVCGLIDSFLERNKVKVQRGMHKQQMKKIDIYESLISVGHRISYTTVCRYVREWEVKSREVYIRQHYEPGQAVEFDWGEVKGNIGGKFKTKMLAVFTSSYSNHRWSQLYNRQDMSSFLHSHAQYFATIGGVHQQVVYDNMRTAVRKFTFSNKDKEPTEDLLKMSCYYKFDYRFCNAGKGNEKGHVERSVEYIRRKAFASHDTFESLEQANDHLHARCQELNKRPLSGRRVSIQTVFEQELRYMKVAPPMYDTAKLTQLRVDKYSCIKVDTNWYSVQEGHVGQMLEVKIYPNQILVYNSQNQCIATHVRTHTRFEYFLQIEHYLKTLRTKPGALSGALTLRQADQSLRDIFSQYFTENPRDFVELLLYLREKKYTIIQLQQAIEKCINVSAHHVVDLDKLKILLQSTKTKNELLGEPAVDELSIAIAQHCTEQLKAIQSLI